MLSGNGQGWSQMIWLVVVAVALTWLGLAAASSAAETAVRSGVYPVTRI